MAQKTENQTYLSLNFVAGHNTDQALNMSLDILCEVLVNQESAPVRLALQEAGIGQDVSASASNYMQNLVQIIVQNANPEDKDKFYSIVMSVLKAQAEKELDKSAVEAVINRQEFLYREGNDAQKGLTNINRSLPTFFFANDPFLGLEYEKPLAEVKKALTTRYLEPIITKYFIDNPHALLLTMAPKPGLEKEASLKVKKELASYKAKLSDKETDALVKETADLIAYQKREDTPEALATIPMLELKDINPKATWQGMEIQHVGKVPLLYHEEFTNDVVYVDHYFDIRVLPEEMIPYASLLCNIIGMMSTENYSFGDLDKALSINTGGFYTNLSTFSENMSDIKMIPKFRVTTKAMNNKLDKLASLTQEILFRTKYNDPERLKQVIMRPPVTTGCKHSQKRTSVRKHAALFLFQQPGHVQRAFLGNGLLLVL